MLLKASDGLEALKLLEENEVHLIILDIMMPNMDGITATFKIREERNIPIIMLSAKVEDSDKIHGLSVGADDYVTKPFHPLELLATSEIAIKTLRPTWYITMDKHLLQSM